MPTPKQYAEGLVNFGLGARFDNPDQPKAEGFYGRVPLPNGGFATEYSVSQDINGKNVEMPSLVPGLTKEEIESIKTSASTGSPLPQSVYNKSREHAVMRTNNNQSPFWGIPEAYTPMPK